MGDARYRNVTADALLVQNLSTLESYFFDESKRGRRIVELHEFVQVISPKLVRVCAE